MATAPRQFKPVDGTLTDGLVALHLSWNPSGSGSSPTLTANQKKNGLVSVTYASATGKFTVVVNGNYTALKSWCGSVTLAGTGAASGLGAVAIYTKDLAASAGATFTIGTYLNGSLANLNASDVVHMTLFLSRSTLES